MSLGGKYVFATVIGIVLPMCILTSCSSVLCVLMALGMFDLKYDDVFVLWLNVVYEWVCAVLLVMGCCVVCAWCCCYELCGCVNDASPVGCVLSLFYMCAVQMNPGCVVCVVTSD